MRWQKKSYSVSLRVSIAIAICRLSWGRMKSIYWEKVFWSPAAPALPVALTKFFGGPGRLFGSAAVHGLFSSVLLHTISIYWFSWGGERVGSLDPAVALTKTLLGAISHAIGIFWFSWGNENHSLRKGRLSWSCHQNWLSSDSLIASSLARHVLARPTDQLGTFHKCLDNCQRLNRQKFNTYFGRIYQLLTFSSVNKVLE